MKKFNGFESHLIVEGLKEVAASMKEGIVKAESEGKRSLMTTSYIDMVVAETIDKVKLNTLKQK